MVYVRAAATYCVSFPKFPSHNFVSCLVWSQIVLFFLARGAWATPYLSHLAQVSAETQVSVTMTTLPNDASLSTSSSQGSASRLQTTDGVASTNLPLIKLLRKTPKVEFVWFLKVFVCLFSKGGYGFLVWLWRRIFVGISSASNRTGYYNSYFTD